MAKTRDELEKEYESIRNFLDTNPTLGQFHSKIDGQYLTSAWLYAILKWKENE